ncbi:MAG TPA: transglutaminase domain-containing protein [Saprospiraceae bacterium]|nr:transglutaminase domain-containing protein [Saprospiraceae bacterium]HPI09130.1 transglutaminase domain-containing protein [Saprospiraceae bacterium]
MRYFLLAFLLSPVWSHGQQFSAVDEHSLNTPNGRTRSIPKLATHLAEGATTDLEKLRAIYAWITMNIDYEDNYASSDFWATPEYIEEQHAKNVLHNRSAVCQGYANLFCALAKELDLPCEVVTGIVKESGGEVPELGHAWVAAQADGSWRLFDPTWGVPAPGMSAYVVNEKYFDTPPDRFILNHLPDDPVWQLLEKPVEERLFRTAGNAEMTAYLADAPDAIFVYQDTLREWLAMDSAQRMLHMENRVLQFNGSNERAIFSLGQNYWGLFYDQHRLLDSLADDAILQDSVVLDTTWFLEQTALLEKYHSRARDLLGRLESRERVAHAQKFYTPGDVEAIIFKLKGSLWTGQFEKAYHRYADRIEESQLLELRNYLEKADAEYEAAERTLNCDKTYNSCLEIWHNRSLVYIQFAQREVTMLEQMLSEKDTRHLSRSLLVYAPEARQFFRKASAEVLKMTLRPPVFALTRERQESIAAGLLAVRSCEIRASRAEQMPALEETLRSASFSFSKADVLLKKLSDIQIVLFQFIDSVENSSAGMNSEVAQNLLFNLNYETFSLQYNLGTLRYRKAWALWQQARKSNTLQLEKENIRAAIEPVLECAKEAGIALAAVARLGQLSTAHVDQRRQQVNKLRDTALQLLDLLEQ